MDNNFDNIPLTKIQKLLSSPAGQQLIEKLQQAEPEITRRATKQASSGDYDQLAQTLSPLLASEEVKKLLKELGG